MKRFTIEDDIHCSVDRFWRIYFDEAFTRSVLLEGLGFAQCEFVSLTEDEREIRRRMRITPRLNLPPAVEKVIGGRLAMQEDGRFDRSSRTYHWRQTLAILSDKLLPSGTIRVEDRGPDRCRRISEQVFEAKIFGVGALIEAAAEKNMRDAWAKAATAINGWLGRNPDGD